MKGDGIKQEECKTKCVRGSNKMKYMRKRKVNQLVIYKAGVKLTRNERRKI